MGHRQYECVRRIRGNLRKWAQEAPLEVDEDDYCLELKCNLFRPLHPETIQELMQGDGDELGAGQSRGKLQALHSSSALACNIFDYWRSVEASALQLALGLNSPIARMRFEQKFPTGARSRASLDLTLHLADSTLHAVESKFLEPYDPTCDKTTIQPIYFTRARWTEVGLPEAQRLAEDLRDGKANNVQHLNVAQLLKHMLGLGRQKQPWLLHLHMVRSGLRSWCVSQG